MSEETLPKTQKKTPPVQGKVRCTLTGQEILAEEAYWAPPLITAWQLIRTIVVTAIRAPSNLGHILFDEQDDVPYAQEAREELASKRTIEQLKLLVFLLLILVLIAAPLYLIFRTS